MPRKNSMTDEQNPDQDFSSTQQTIEDDFDPGLIFGTSNRLPKLPSDNPNDPSYDQNWHFAWVGIPTQLIPEQASTYAMYQMAGYRPITVDEFNHVTGINAATFDVWRTKDDNAAFTGCVRVRDSVAHKIPRNKWKQITKYLEDEVRKREHEMKVRPHHMKQVGYDNIQVEHKTFQKVSTSDQELFDKLG